MAKKKKPKNAPETSAAPLSREAPVAAKAEPTSLERAFAIGNFAAVRRLARQTPGADADRLLSLVRVDRVTLLVGLGALLVLIGVAMVVLRTG